MYVCPICKQKLNKRDGGYVCEKNHSFDVARQGYVNLLPVSGKKSLSPGDNELMTCARREFLSEGYYDKLLDKICSILEEFNVQTLVDSGCSEGYYTKSMAKLCNTVYAYDISKSAVKLASAVDKSTNYFVASAFHIPIKDGSCDAVTKIFAPDSPQEFARILRKNGLLIEVIPEKEHLIEIKRKLYESVYLNKVDKPEKDGFTLVREEPLKYLFTPTKKGLENLFKMTPYYYKTSKEGQDKLLNCESLPITADFLIRIYSKSL